MTIFLKIYIVGALWVIWGLKFRPIQTLNFLSTLRFFLKATFCMFRFIFLKQELRLTQKMGDKTIKVITWERLK